MRNPEEVQAELDAAWKTRRESFQKGMKLKDPAKRKKSKKEWNKLRAKIAALTKELKETRKASGAVRRASKPSTGRKERKPKNACCDKPDLFYEPEGEVVKQHCRNCQTMKTVQMEEVRNEGMGQIVGKGSSMRVDAFCKVLFGTPAWYAEMGNEKVREEAQRVRAVMLVKGRSRSENNVHPAWMVAVDGSVHEVTGLR